MINVKYTLDTEHNVYVAFARYQADVPQVFMTEAATIQILQDRIQECIELSFDELDIEAPSYTLEELTLIDFSAIVNQTITELDQ